jgi:hypothetical protein
MIRPRTGLVVSLTKPLSWSQPCIVSLPCFVPSTRPITLPWRPAASLDYKLVSRCWAFPHTYPRDFLPSPDRWFCSQEYPSHFLQVLILQHFSSCLQRSHYTLRSPLNNNWASLSRTHTPSHTYSQRFQANLCLPQTRSSIQHISPTRTTSTHNSQDACLLLPRGTSSPGLRLVRAHSPHTRNWQRNIMRLRRQSLRRVLYPQ